MKNNPLISILIPNYNKGLYLRETLDSVLAQTYENWECIIVDDHSTDNSWEILEEYAAKDKRFKVYKRPLNRKKGGNAARNYAFEMSQGKYINWLDSDDLFVNSKIEEQIKLLIRDDNDFVLCKIKNNVNGEERLSFFFEKKTSKRPIKFLKGSFWFQTSVPLFKRAFLEKFPVLFDEKKIRHQESVFFTYLLFHKPSIGFIDSYYMIRRDSIDSKTQNYNSKEFNDRLVLDFPLAYDTFKMFNKFKFHDNESIQYYNQVFINMIQYSNLDLFLRFKILINLIFYKSKMPVKFLGLKSFIYRLLNGE